MAHEIDCPVCDGEGVIPVVVAGPDYFGNYDVDEVDCHNCDGLGVITIIEEDR